MTSPEPDDLLDTAVDAIDELFYVIGTDREIVRLNSRIETVTGYSESELTSMDPATLFPDADRGHVEATIEEAFETGTSHLETELLTQRGERIPYEFRQRRITDDDGIVLGVVGVGRDVSRHRHRTRELRSLHEASQKLLRVDSPQEVAELTVRSLKEILDMPINTIWYYDPDDQLLEPVDSTIESEALLGQPPTYGHDMSLSWEAFESGETRVFDDLREDSRRHNPDTAIRSEIILPLEEHGVVNIGSTAPNAFDEADLQCAELWAATVTLVLSRLERERRLQEREGDLQRERDRLEEFASLVSHDLRNPLNVAAGRIDLVRQKRDDEDLEAADRALDRMETLVEDMLTLAREGRQVDELEPVSLPDLVRECWANVDTGETELQALAEATIRADRSRLAQVFENLFRNSVEHGGGAVTITVGDLPAGFFLEDTGPGIAAADRDRVFEAGYTTSASGTGFGLRIIRDIVQTHGWNIDITAASTGGVRFEITGADVLEP
jgi:PAS domain S-box-containing protein